ncbi:head-tail connector protein [Selenomonas sp. AB3002]|uniref:head-tail connector protein n=1 Tax=Selenomonas sp. AB3002 TaxID=1392502 RepID=UPI00049501B8
MAVTLAQVKDYLRIDADHENALLGTFMAAADSYLVAAVDGFTDKLSDTDFASKADMVKLALVSEMYRNRDPSNDQRTSFPYYIQSMIAQLQYWGDVVTEENSS